MEKFDAIVIGSGGGIFVVFDAVSEGMDVALVDQGPLGGSCPNNACIPSKILITPAEMAGPAPVRPLSILISRPGP